MERNNMSAKTYELMFEIAGSMNQKFAAVFKKAANPNEDRRGTS